MFTHKLQVGFDGTLSNLGHLNPIPHVPNLALSLKKSIRKCWTIIQKQIPYREGSNFNVDCTSMYTEAWGGILSCYTDHVKWALRSKLFPALEEVLGCHLCRLKKLVKHHRELHCNVLKGSTVSVHTGPQINIQNWPSTSTFKKKKSHIQAPTWTGCWALVHLWSRTHTQCWGSAGPERHLLLWGLLS